MRIDDRIFVHHPELIGLDPAATEFVDLEGALHEAAAGATEITILGGYYNPERMMALCERVPRDHRRYCRVRIAIGLQATALIPRTWTDMRDVRDDHAAEAFEASFYADLASRLAAVGVATGRIVRSLTRGIGLAGVETADEIADALASRLEARSWDDEEWILD